MNMEEFTAPTADPSDGAADHFVQRFGDLPGGTRSPDARGSDRVYGRLIRIGAAVSA